MFHAMGVLLSVLPGDVLLLQLQKGLLSFFMAFPYFTLKARITQSTSSHKISETNFSFSMN